MPTTDSGKAIASRNATTHGLFARDVVLPALGEDPEGYRQLEAEWMAQLPPRTLLERHYVEKIAAASWRLRRLHRWQAQLFEDDSLAESDRLDRLDRAMRHETALPALADPEGRQIDTAVKMLNKDAPQLFAQRARDQVLEDHQISDRECREDAEDDRAVTMEIRNRLYQLRKATAQAVNELSEAPLDARPSEICENELPAPEIQGGNEHGEVGGPAKDGHTQKCENEPAPSHRDPHQRIEQPDSGHRIDPDRGRGRRGPHRRERFSLRMPPPAIKAEADLAHSAPIPPELGARGPLSIHCGLPTKSCESSS